MTVRAAFGMPSRALRLLRQSAAHGRLVLAFALRDLRGGLGGFHVFVASIALGVGIVAAAGTLSAALHASFERQGRTLLGGDVAVSRMHTRAAAHERAWLAAEAVNGRVSETATLRAMARHPGGTGQALIELKAVDAAYPLAGGVTLAGGGTLAGAIHEGKGAVADAVLLARLGLKTGDEVVIGAARVPIRAVLANEPDMLLDRVSYGARVFVSLETLEQTGLVRPGSLVRWRYVLDLRDTGGEAFAGTFAAFRERLKAALPESGLSSAGRHDPSPQIRQLLGHLRQFLVLTGLAALAVGGTGIAGTVAAFIGRRRRTIATLKCLGAGNRLIFHVFLAEILLVAAFGTVAGLGLGVLVPPAIEGLYGASLPVHLHLSVPAGSLAAAAAYGLLVTLLFAAWPLSRAERVSPAALFREEAVPHAAWPRPAVLVLLAGAAALAAAVLVLSSGSPRLAAYFCAGTAAVLAVFHAAGAAISLAARRLARPAVPELALALGSLSAPGGTARQVTLSLGTSLTLLVTVALAEASLTQELAGTVTEQSPDYFVLDVPKGEASALAGLMARKVPGSVTDTAPMLRGRFVRLRGVPVEEVKVAPEAEWVLAGDRGLTYSATVPEGSRLVAGTWWAADHAGEPLVSFEAEIAGKLGLKIGDTVTVNILGRDVTARIASLREVQWESLAINFIMVFSPDTLAGAPHTLVGKITFPPGTPLPVETEAIRALTAAYPMAPAIRIKDAAEAFNGMFQKVMTAVRVASGVLLLAGALVLAGALTPVHRRRAAESALLKVLGATRGRIVAARFVEYGCLAAAAAAAATGLGAVLAWLLVTRLMEVPLVFSWAVAGQAVGLALALAWVFGGIGTWRTLSAPPVRYLRPD